MYATDTLFDVETEAGTVVVTPQESWFALHGSADEAEARQLLEHLQTRPTTHVVLDLCQTSGCDSSALGFCMRLWKQVQPRGGRIALCNLSDNERQMLQVTKL